MRTGLKQLLKIWFIIRHKNIAFAVTASKAFLLNYLESMLSLVGISLHAMKIWLCCLETGIRNA